MKSVLKYIVYKVLYPFLLVISYDKFLRRFSKNRRLIVFFHGVGEVDPFRINGRHIPKKDFEKILRYFKKNYNIVSLEEICQMKLNEESPKRHTLALTFDDGFQNNVKVALPLLEQYQLPATFFISSMSVEDPHYIHPADFLDLVKVKEPEGGIEFNGQTFIKSRDQLVHEKSGQSVYHYLCTLTLNELTSALTKLENRYGMSLLTKGIHKEVYQLITKHSLPDLLTYKKARVGSHCHMHVNLCMLSKKEITEQLASSKRILEAYSRPVTSVAFPYGDFNKEIVALAKEAGFQYLIAGGDVGEEFSEDVFPRIGISTLPGVSRTILSINSGFSRFGF